jgi:hypothetical protein
VQCPWRVHFTTTNADQDMQSTLWLSRDGSSSEITRSDQLKLDLDSTNITVSHNVKMRSDFVENGLEFDLAAPDGLQLLVAHLADLGVEIKDDV